MGLFLDCVDDCIVSCKKHGKSVPFLRAWSGFNSNESSTLFLKPLIKGICGIHSANRAFRTF